MKYEDVKRVVVDENQWVTHKALTRMAINMALFLGLFAVGLSILAAATVSSALMIFILIMAAVMYVWLFDMATESEKTFKVLRRLVSLWPLTLLFVVGVYLLLKYLQFL